MQVVTFPRRIKPNRLKVAVLCRLYSEIFIKKSKSIGNWYMCIRIQKASFFGGLFGCNRNKFDTL
jgi:hypothetical protein